LRLAVTTERFSAAGCRELRDAEAASGAMESVFALLQKNVLDRRRWEIRDQLRLAIITWIERTYHRRRRQRRLGKLTPSNTRCSSLRSH
jgi:transposase InsO family protein